MPITITHSVDKYETRIELANSFSNYITVRWSLAPHWANWWAMDYNGKCYWYEQKPSCERATVPRCFVKSGSTDRARINVLVCPHESFFPYWRETLCKRPGKRVIGFPTSRYPPLKTLFRL